MKITISGPAAAYDADENEIEKAAELKKVDGLVYGDEVCSNYLDPELDDVGIEGGELRIVFDPAKKRLRVVTEYRSPRQLEPAELAALVDQTQGQWSDGIGEGCFDEFAEQSGITIDPYPLDQATDDVQVEQIDDGVKVARKRYSPLLKAAENGDLAKLESLLAKGENIDARNKHDHTVLMCAINHDQIDAANWLIERGADVNLKSKDQSSAINTAAMRGHAQIVEKLIQHGADVNERDQRGATPAMWASNRGHMDVLMQLVEADANLNLQDMMQDNDGKTALMYAAPHRLDVVRLLLTHGADPSVRDSEGLTASEQALQQAEGFRRFGDHDTAALHEKKADLLKNVF